MDEIFGGFRLRLYGNSMENLLYKIGEICDKI